MMNSDDYRQRLYENMDQLASIDFYLADLYSLNAEALESRDFDRITEAAMNLTETINRRAAAAQNYLSAMNMLIEQLALEQKFPGPGDK